MQIVINNTTTLEVTSVTETYFYESNTQELIVNLNVTHSNNIDTIKTELDALENTVCSIVLNGEEIIEEIQYDNYQLNTLRDSVEVTGRYITITFNKISV